jgi:hypothetical protein
MAVIGSGVATLLDVLRELAPDGSQLDTAEVLTEHTEVLQDMTWMEGNLVTGHRDSVRTVLPEPSFRAINEGVPVTKGATTPVEETTALLEDFSQADRELALLSGNVSRFRLKQAKPHQIGFAHKMARTLFYGNAATAPKEFTGLAPRYNTGDTAVSQTAANVLDAGGSGADLRSIWLIGWSDETITGLYPKGTPGGLQHEDATSHMAGGDGMVLLDGDGNQYIGYRDHWVWRCGLMVKDWRYAVRIANIDLSELTIDAATGPNLQNLMIQATEIIEGLSGVRAAWYMPRAIRSMLRQQLIEKKNAYLSLNEQGGRTTLQFDEIPIRRTDALNVSEEEVMGF